MWYLNNLQPVFSCPHEVRVGGHGDGPKWTCDPHRLLKKECLVYSVGSLGSYEWEDGLVDLIGTHCEIHIFDPGNYARDGDPEGKNIHYHNWGLISSYDSKYKMNGRRAGTFNMMTFRQIKEKLGHQKRTIDILKIDCEKCEW